jgi:hypothetical protein
LTEIDLEPAGDTRFPELPTDFHCSERVDVSGPTHYTLLTYRRTTNRCETVS